MQVICQKFDSFLRITTICFREFLTFRLFQIGPGVRWQLTCTFLQYILQNEHTQNNNVKNENHFANEGHVKYIFNTVFSLQCIKIKGEQILCLKTTLEVEIRPGGIVLKLVGTRGISILGWRYLQLGPVSSKRSMSKRGGKNIHSKGQFILKCPFGVYKSPKNPTKFFPGFLPQPLKRCQIKKIRALFTANWRLLSTLLRYFFDLTSFQRLGQKSWKKIRWFIVKRD